MKRHLDRDLKICANMEQRPNEDSINMAKGQIPYSTILASRLECARDHEQSDSDLLKS